MAGLPDFSTHVLFWKGLQATLPRIGTTYNIHVERSRLANDPGLSSRVFTFGQWLPVFSDGWEWMGDRPLPGPSAGCSAKSRAARGCPNGNSARHATG